MPTNEPPTPWWLFFFPPVVLGDFVQYVPSANELLICAGIWAFGLLLYSFFLKAAIPIVNAEEQRKRY